MRNSRVMAIAPNARISAIFEVGPSIEPTYRNLFVNTSLSADFIQVNRYLVRDLKRAGLWDASIMDDLKYHDGSLQDIERIPRDIRERYRNAFEIDPQWLHECAARCQKWIDGGPSHNVYL